MKFEVTGRLHTTYKRHRRVRTVLDITKKEVMRVTDCPANVDGDSTAWYEYVEEAIKDPSCRYELDVYEDGSDEGHEEFKTAFTEVWSVDW